MSERVRIRWEGFVGELKARETFEVLLSSDVTRFVLTQRVRISFSDLERELSHQPSSFLTSAVKKLRNLASCNVKQCRFQPNKNCDSAGSE